MASARDAVAFQSDDSDDSSAESHQSKSSQSRSRWQRLSPKQQIGAASGAAVGATALVVGTVMVASGKVDLGLTRGAARATFTGPPPPWGPERWGSARGLKTQHQTCLSVSTCGECSNDAKLAKCAEKVKEAMQLEEGELHNKYNPFMFKERFGGWNQWYLSMHKAELKSDDFQMMLYLHDGDDGACPKPCLTEVPASPYMCAPNNKFIAPPKDALDYNGITWPEMCFEDDRSEEHVLLIGDWGGIRPGKPANNLLVDKWPGPVKVHRRAWVTGIDDQAQYLVAQEFNKRAAKLHAEGVGPRYVLNVGDNFYWGGCDGGCGAMSMEESVKSFYRPAYESNENHCSEQFYGIYETMYMGPGVNGIPWLSVLGNHDYGGYKYIKAWDLQIAYTWGPSGRWVLPALYWHQHVNYPTKQFDIDYYFIDTNVIDTGETWADSGHNICGAKYNRGGNTNCKPNAAGPAGVGECKQWFADLWQKQTKWLDESLEKSTATWQIIVTHIPLEACGLHGGEGNRDIEGTGHRVVMDIRNLAVKHGIDLIIAGHRHQQELHPNGFGRWCKGTEAGVPYVITGGGGGIATEGLPSEKNNQYGYMDMILTSDLITIKAFNQHGHLRGTMEVTPRERGHEITDVDPWANMTSDDDTDLVT
eukprot:TRINITY_DN327_c0_g1_i4.p1 TRINITY_DN327_c0_g1~~TRINITY_DN327_c0_g1_i4.p1  ORF type:complete len:670 (-),score=91.26 TRINITY_DN327_c0_g1_i4:147-2084(-)